MIKLLKKIFKPKIEAKKPYTIEQIDPLEKKEKIDEENSIYPVDSLSSIEDAYCKQEQKESACEMNAKFTVKNFLLKKSV